MSSPSRSNSPAPAQVIWCPSGRCGIDSLAPCRHSPSPSSVSTSFTRARMSSQMPFSRCSRSSTRSCRRAEASARASTSGWASPHASWCAGSARSSPGRPWRTGRRLPPCVPPRVAGAAGRGGRGRRRRSARGAARSSGRCLGVSRAVWSIHGRRLHLAPPASNAPSCRRPRAFESTAPAAASASSARQAALFAQIRGSWRSSSSRRSSSASAQITWCPPSSAPITSGRRRPVRRHGVASMALLLLRWPGVWAISSSGASRLFREVRYSVQRTALPLPHHFQPPAFPTNQFGAAPILVYIYSESGAEGSIRDNSNILTFVSDVIAELPRLVCLALSSRRHKINPSR